MFFCSRTVCATRWVDRRPPGAFCDCGSRSSCVVSSQGWATPMTTKRRSKGVAARRHEDMAVIMVERPWCCKLTTILVSNAVDFKMVNKPLLLTRATLVGMCDNRRIVSAMGGALGRALRPPPLAAGTKPLKKGSTAANSRHLCLELLSSPAQEFKRRRRRPQIIIKRPVAMSFRLGARSNM